MGRPRDLVRDAWVQRFGLKTNRPRGLLSSAMLNTLSCCKSDEARRILLGISEQEVASTTPATERIGVDVRSFLEQKPASRRSVA